MRSSAPLTGPATSLEREEEWMIRDYFQDRRGGVFVDVGANHYQEASKTYYLETRLGWSGIAIEPQRELQADYATLQAAHEILPVFRVGRLERRRPPVRDQGSSTVASSDKEFVKQFGTPDEVRDVPTITLTDLLDAEGFARSISCRWTSSCTSRRR